MQIGINLLYLIPGKVGGTETYARELIPSLINTRDKIYIFCGRETAPTFPSLPNCQVVTLPIYSTNRLARILVEQTMLPWLCFKYKLDVIFSLGYSSPFIHPCPAIVTIHDLNYHYHPEDFGILSRTIWQIMTYLSAHTADHVITDSEASAKSISQILKVKESKVSAILHGTPSVLKTTKKQPKTPYIFTVLANYPHKNLKTLLAAFKRLSETTEDLDLIICGLGKQPSSSSKVEYLGYVSRQELADLYTNASVFVFPSAYEGFGYPVLEAMSYGTPVVSSNAFSLKEVVGDAGILVEPYDIPSYVKAIKSILSSDKVKKSFINKGRKRVSELQWTYTAEKTLKTLKESTI